MTMISSYYAQVGVGIDQKSVGQVKKYLDSIEKQFHGFQSRLSKVKPISVRVNIDRAKSMTLLQRDLNALGKTAKINIRNVNFSRTEVQRKLNAALSSTNGSTRIRMGALLSRESLTAMKDQIRTSINGLVVNPTINPRMRQATVRGGGGGGSRGGGGGHGGGATSFTTQSPHGRRNFSPWHNPMMVGGGAGAFMRYGVYSLPFIAGAVGLNSLTNKAQTLESQQLLLNASTGNRQVAAGQMKFLSGVGDRLGLTTEMLAPQFAQMHAGAKGTALEAELPKGFESFLEYSSVVGLNGEQMKGSIRAISQMIAKRGIYSEELRQQLAEHGMPMAMKIMADAVAGGDMKKLSKMMELGQVDPVDALPKFFAALKAEAAPFLADFYKTIARNRGTAEKATEDWMKKFLGGGTSDALASFFETWTQLIHDAIPHAERLGAVFAGMVHYFNAAMLAPGEMIQWFNGEATEGNFMNSLFGEFKEHKAFQGISKEIDQLKLNMSTIGNSGEFTMLKTTLKEIEAVLVAINSLLSTINSSIEGLRVLRQEGVSGFFKHTAENQDVIDSENMARNQLAKENPNYTKADLANRTSQLFATVQRNREESLIPPMFQGAASDAPDKWFGGSFPRNGVPSGQSSLPLNTHNAGDAAGSGPIVPMNIPTISPPSMFQDRNAKLSVELSGTIKVDGAVSDDITFSESIRGGIEGVLQDHFRNSLGNSSHGVQ